jgi:DNA gyrase subunit A
VTNLKATPKVGKTTSILLVNETSELMVISQWGKIIRIDTNTVRSAGRNTQGVRLLNLEADDKVAAAVIIPPDEVNGKEDEQGTLIQ